MGEHIRKKNKEKDEHYFDTSNIDKNHTLHSNENHRVLGKLSSETGLVPPLNLSD